MMYDEDIPQIGAVASARIAEATEKARDAFWASVGESFPEVTSGDFDLGETIALESATNEAIVAWLMYNHPSVAIT